MIRPLLSALPVFALATAVALPAQTVLKKDVAKIYQEICANCHGQNLEGGQAPSMLDEAWAVGRGSDEDLARIIRDGALDKGMPAFHSLMTEGDIRTMVIFIRERRAQAKNRLVPKIDPAGVNEAAGERFRVELVADGLGVPWALAFAPDGRLFFTEKSGNVRIFERGRVSAPVKGTPAVRDAGQGGLMEIALHPQFADNGWIYLAYSDPAKDANGREVSLTTIVRGRIQEGRWVDQQRIWMAPLEFYRPGGGVHFGCRIAFDGQGYLYFSHGERGRKEEAQELRRPNGKIHRIHDDGRIPADNPFAGTPGAFPSIWTYGNRNPQGLAFDPRTGLLWETEHGPRGGDELNLIRRGLNYGWPLISYGMNYDGSAVTDRTAQEGLEQPALFWTPSLAVCGLEFYTGGAFPRWQGNLLVASLAAQELRRVVIDGDRAVSQELILKGIGRIRDVAPGPDGAVYLALNEPGRIVRLVPAK